VHGLRTRSLRALGRLPDRNRQTAGGVLSSATMADPRTTRRFQLLLLVAALALFLYVASPFAKPILLAATIAAILDPAHLRLTAALRGRRAASAGVLSAAVVAAIVGPVAYLVTAFVWQVVAGVRWLRAALESEGVSGLVARLPEPLRKIATDVTADMPLALERAREAFEGAGGAAAVGGIISATGTLVVNTLVMVVAVYFLLAEGHRLIEWLDEMTPLEPGQLRELLATFNGAVGAVVVSALATAGVQAALAFAGFLVAGVPQPAFFAILTFVAALVPLVGANLVVLPVAAFHFAAGHAVAAGLLALWSLGVVGTVDNLLKPVLMRRGLSVHVSLVFLALLGGLATFGAAGIIVGPLALAFFLAAVRMWHPRQAGDTPAGPRAPPSEVPGA
jgi:predicted PurR-regulated permease PerM